MIAALPVDVSQRRDVGGALAIGAFVALWASASIPGSCQEAR